MRVVDSIPARSTTRGSYGPGEAEKTARSATGKRSTQTFLNNRISTFIYPSPFTYISIKMNRSFLLSLNAGLHPPKIRSHDSEHFPRVVLALLGVKIASVHCGSRHTIALPEIHATGVLEGDLSTNTAAAAALPGAAALYSWGWGAYGQLGLGDRASQVRSMRLLICS